MELSGNIWVWVKTKPHQMLDWWTSFIAWIFCLSLAILDVQWSKHFIWGISIPSSVGIPSDAYNKPNQPNNRGGCSSLLWKNKWCFHPGPYGSLTLERGWKGIMFIEWSSMFTDLCPFTWKVRAVKKGSVISCWVDKIQPLEMNVSAQQGLNMPKWTSAQCSTHIITWYNMAMESSGFTSKFGWQWMLIMVKFQSATACSRILLRLLRLRLRFPLSESRAGRSSWNPKSRAGRSGKKHGKTSFENLCHSTYPSYLDHFRSIYSTPQLAILGISPPFPLISSGVQGNDCSPKPLTYLDQCCHAKHLLRLRFLSSLESPAVHIPSFVAKMQNVD